jgi:hypothetical protein
MGRVESQVWGDRGNGDLGRVVSPPNAGLAATGTERTSERVIVHPDVQTGGRARVGPGCIIDGGWPRALVADHEPCGRDGVMEQRGCRTAGRAALVAAAVPAPGTVRDDRTVINRVDRRQGSEQSASLEVARNPSHA